MSLLFQDICQEGYKIADLGCGPEGAFWWDELPPKCIVEAYDLFNTPNKCTRGSIHTIFFQKDVTKLYCEKALQEKYNLVVADHIFEHVNDPEALAASIAHILKPQGYLHVGIPDANNFTDRFYRLIHPDGGGHIQQFTRQSFLSLIEKFGFQLHEIKPWPDDWGWLEKLYNLKAYGVKYLKQEELQYLVEIFRKELTLAKGYLYGWEFLLIKSRAVTIDNYSYYPNVDFLKL